MIVYKASNNPYFTKDVDKIFYTEEEALRYALKNISVNSDDEGIRVIEKVKMEGLKVLKVEDLYSMDNDFLRGVQYMKVGTYYNGANFVVVEKIENKKYGYKETIFTKNSAGAILGENNKLEINGTEYICQNVFKGREQANYFIAYPKGEKGYDYDKAIKYKIKGE